MITYKPIVIPGGRRQDGTWPVKIRVTFKGVSRRLPTTLVCYDADLTRSGKIKNATILQKAGELIRRMRDTTADLSPFALEAWDVDKVVAHIRDKMQAEVFRLDFFTFADGFLESKSPSTRRAYDGALTAFARFLGKREIDVNDITRPLIVSFADSENGVGKRHRTRDGWTVTEHPKIEGGISSRNVGKLSHIFDAARLRYNDEDADRILIRRSPFDGLPKAYPKGKGQRNIGAELIQRLIDAKPACEEEAIAIDTFLLSFVTMGANLADIYAAREVKTDTWTYNRRKTASRRADKAEVRVYLSGPARWLLRRLRGQSGGAWMVPALHRWSADGVTHAVNRRLRIWAEREGVEVFTFYAARHTWATLARRQGVEKATVDEALAHVGDFRITDIYAERSWELAWSANDKVLALFSWPDVESQG